jgi:hypothetical protein
MRTPKRVQRKIDAQVTELKEMVIQFEDALNKLKQTTAVLDFMNRGMKGWEQD